MGPWIGLIKPFKQKVYLVKRRRIKLYNENLINNIELVRTLKANMVDTPPLFWR